MLDFQEGVKIRRRVPRKFLVIGVAIAVISTVFAANISINSGKKIEFGQGIFQVKACDQWIGIGYTASPAVYSGLSRVQNITIYGLDTTACNNTNLRLSFYTTGNNTARDLFTGQGASGTVTSKYLTLRVSSSLGSAAMDRVTLISPAGQVLTNYYDSYESIDPGYDSSGNFDGSFMVTFQQPLLLVPDLNKVVLESASVTG